MKNSNFAEFEKCCDKPIDYIAIDRFHSFDWKNVIECVSIIVFVGESKFKISCKDYGNDKEDIQFRTLFDFSPSEWPRRILSTDEEPIVFVRRVYMDSLVCLWFHIGNRFLLVTARDRLLTIGIARENDNEDFSKIVDFRLLNDQKCT